MSRIICRPIQNSDPINKIHDILNTSDVCATHGIPTQKEGREIMRVRKV